MHQRPQHPASRTAMQAFAARISPSSSRLNLSAMAGSRFGSSKEPPLLPSVVTSLGVSGKAATGNGSGTDSSPMICGMPLKYISLLTLAAQNAALSIVMHYSRVSTPASKSYSPATAVLLNELLKGSISFVIAFMRTSNIPPSSPSLRRSPIGFPSTSPSWTRRLYYLTAEILSPDCFKLSVPAILYVIQNSLQFVAISNLPVASFQVAYQMKIMTTAAFSVGLLGKRLTKAKWLALLLLALGVGIVQVQTATSNGVPSHHSEPVGSAAAAAPKHMHVMNPLKGFAAVTAACFTSGLAGVYFEMVLKNSKADLWVRNVQLSLFSIVPALLPIFYTSASARAASTHGGLLGGLFANFGGWAWATVGIQVFGGLVTAVVIKYSDNILKGFATSLSILLSFLASVALFDFRITPGFVLGASTVLAATWMYNQPPVASPGSGNAFAATCLVAPREKDLPHVIASTVGRNDPILGEKPIMRKSSSFGSSTQSLSNYFGLGVSASEKEKERLSQCEEEMPFLSYASRTSSHSQFGASPLESRAPSPSTSETSTTNSLLPPNDRWRL